MREVPVNKRCPDQSPSQEARPNLLQEPWTPQLKNLKGTGYNENTDRYPSEISFSSHEQKNDQDPEDLIQKPSSIVVEPQSPRTGIEFEQKPQGRDDQEASNDVFSYDRILHNCVIRYGHRNQMIPLRDENPSRTIPVVNICLILAYLSVFVYQYYFATGGPVQLTLRLGFIPYEVTNVVDLSPKNLVPVPLNILTSMFLHGGWLHLLGNILYLWIFWDNVEDMLGHFKYLFFYFMCGLMASLTHGLLNLS